MTQVLAEEDACGAGVERYARVLDPWLEPMLARLVELAAVGPGGRVLDLATGTGRGRRLAARQGASAVGIDVSPGMIAFALRRSPPRSAPGRRGGAAPLRRRSVHTRHLPLSIGPGLSPR
jgi:SAM-dependent methyltransferase